MAGVGAFLYKLKLLVECFFSQILLHKETSMWSQILKFSYSKNARTAGKTLSCQLVEGNNRVRVIQPLKDIKAKSEMKI